MPVTPYYTKPNEKPSLREIVELYADDEFWGKRGSPLHRNQPAEFVESLAVNYPPGSLDMAIKEADELTRVLHRSETKGKHMDPDNVFVAVWRREFLFGWIANTQLSSLRDIQRRLEWAGETMEAEDGDVNASYLRSVCLSTRRDLKGLWKVDPHQQALELLKQRGGMLQD